MLLSYSMHKIENMNKKEWYDFYNKINYKINLTFFIEN